MPDEPEALTVAWVGGEGGTRCTIADREGQWVVAVEVEEVLVARCVCRTLVEAVSASDRWRMFFVPCLSRSAELAARIERLERLVAELSTVKDESPEYRELATRMTREIALLRTELKAIRAT